MKEQTKTTTRMQHVKKQLRKEFNFTTEIDPGILKIKKYHDLPVADLKEQARKIKHVTDVTESKYMIFVHVNEATKKNVASENGNGTSDARSHSYSKVAMSLQSAISALGIPHQVTKETTDGIFIKITDPTEQDLVKSFVRLFASKNNTQMKVWGHRKEHVIGIQARTNVTGFLSFCQQLQKRKTQMRAVEGEKEFQHVLKKFLDAYVSMKVVTLEPRKRGPVIYCLGHSEQDALYARTIVRLLGLEVIETRSSKKIGFLVPAPQEHVEVLESQEETSEASEEGISFQFPGGRSRSESEDALSDAVVQLVQTLPDAEQEKVREALIERTDLLTNELIEFLRFLKHNHNVVCVKQDDFFKAEGTTLRPKSVGKKKLDDIIIEFLEID